MDAFSLDHDKDGIKFAKKGGELSNAVDSGAFGFNKGGQDTFSNAFTSVDSELARLHSKFDDDSKKDAKKKDSVMPAFSLFTHFADAGKLKDTKLDSAKLEAPEATAEKETLVKKETTLNINGEIVHPAAPLELPSFAEQNKLRNVLGLEAMPGFGDKTSTTTFTSLID